MKSLKCNLLFFLTLFILGTAIGCQVDRNGSMEYRFIEGVVDEYVISEFLTEDLALVSSVSEEISKKELKVSFFTASARANLKGVFNESNVRIIGYVRSDSQGIPVLGPSELPLEIDLPAGPSYRSYQELVVISGIVGTEPFGSNPEP